MTTLARLGCILLALGLSAASVGGQGEVKIIYPKGTIWLDLDAKGLVRAPGRKEPLNTDAEVKHYLAGELAAATKRVRADGEKSARPLVMVRVRQELPTGSAEKLRTLARAEGYRSGIDLLITKIASTSTTPARTPPGTIIVTILAGDQFEITGRKGTISSTDDLLKALKEEQPTAEKAARKARGKTAKPTIQVRLAKDAGEVTKAVKLMVKMALVEGFGATTLNSSRVDATTVKKKVEIDK